MRSLAGLGLEVVVAGRDARFRGVLEGELCTGLAKGCDVAQLVVGDFDKETFEGVEDDAGLGVVGLEFVANFRVEIVEHLGAGLLHLLVDLLRILRFESSKRSIDLGGSLAVVKDVGDVLLKIQAIFDLAENLIGGAEHGGEQLELLREQF